MTFSLAVVGATGRMGSRTVSLCNSLAGFEVTHQLNSASSLDELARVDGVIDFSPSDVSENVVRLALAFGKKVLVGSSGWSTQRIERIRSLCPVDDPVSLVIIPNFSRGSVLATRLAAVVSPYFEDCEIVETHHSLKKDYPSGTAVRTAELIGVSREKSHTRLTPGTGVENNFVENGSDSGDQVSRGTLVSGVPIHSMRLSGALAKQDVHFAGGGEKMVISHETFSQTSYDAGIVSCVRALPGTVGLTVGLEHFLDFPEFLRG